ncbi:MAG TPA: hypothetical protein VKB58_06540 [Terriglobales bacterium]|jgi:hypothetical protein|nr:hypothetical protein [Terriglobales bacterium]
MDKRTLIVSILGTGLSLVLLSTVAMRKAVGITHRGEDSKGATLQTSTSNQQSPFACNLGALDVKARIRHFVELGPQLRSQRKAARELPDGYEFQFPADPTTIAKVAEWAAGERLCCPFFNIELRMEAEGGPFWLRLTGRPGTKEFIKVDAASWVSQ